MDDSKRDFVRKACLGTMCLCGLSNIANAKIFDNLEVKSAPPKQMQVNWILEVLKNVDQNLSEEERRKIIKSASIAEYENQNVETNMAQYKGDIKKFISFLEKDWGWICNFENDGKTLIINENKNVCVCPLLKDTVGKLYPAMCYCSEGFAERMFSFILGYQVTATVVSSIHRGGERCIYKILL